MSLLNGRERKRGERERMIGERGGLRERDEGRLEDIGRERRERGSRRDERWEEIEKEERWGDIEREKERETKGD